MRRGELVHEDDVLHERGRDVQLDVDGDPPFNVDGEVLALHAAHFTVLGRVGVVVP
jgi:diacylglycerol kinase family enzyme